MTNRQTWVSLIAIMFGGAILIFHGITIGLPSEQRMQTELGGTSVLDAAQPQIATFLSSKKQDRTEFLAYSERGALAELSPYFDQLRSYHPDEQYILKVLSGMVRDHDFQPRNYIYPPFFFYQVATGLAIGKITGVLPGAGNTMYFLQHPDQSARVYLAARITIALMAMTGIFLVFYCGKILSGNSAGLTAAMLMAAIPLYALAGKFIKPDVPCLVWSTLALLFAVLAFRHGRWRDYLFSGICVGLAESSKYPGVLSALFPAGYFLARHWPPARTQWRHTLTAPETRQGFFALCGAGLACIAAFILVNPSCILDAATFRRDFAWISSVLREQHFFYNLSEFLFCLGSDGIFYHTGILMLPLLAAGVVFAILRPKRELLPLLPIIAVYLVMGSRGRPGSDAYMLPALPVLCLLSATMLMQIPSRLWRHLIIAATVVSSFLYSYAIGSTAARENIRLTATKWIRENIPAGKSIGRYQYAVSYRSVMTPPLSYPAAALLTDPKAKECDYFISTSFEWESFCSPWKARLVEAALPPPPASDYQLVKVFSEPPRIIGLLPMRQRGYVVSPYLDTIFPVIVIYQKKGSAQHVQR